MDINAKPYYLRELSRINILLGKNGSGKSTLLKKVEQVLSVQKRGEINYVTPERGGSLSFNSSVEHNTLSNETWAKETKRRNQWAEYKNYVFSQYKKLEILSLREIEKDEKTRQDLTYSFDTLIEKINNLLTNVKIERTKKGAFEIFSKITNEPINPEQISSGESELIALAIECLNFEKISETGKENYLLLDEPDVHLHPDLQVNFISLLITLVQSNKFSIIIATHSTAILGALLGYQDSRFAILTNGATEVVFKPINDMYQKILPVFGAHPLSNLFNQSPILLVEGEDDVRIFQQAIRTSKGALKLYPCAVEGLPNMNPYEQAVRELLNGIYDNARAFSLRDRDDIEEAIADLPPLIRVRTACRAVENLILTDEVLTTIETNWQTLSIAIKTWIERETDHPKHAFMVEFQDSGFNRKEFDLKEIRNVLIGLTPSTKSWEVAVGITIGRLVNKEISINFNTNKICNYLGEKIMKQVLRIAE